MSSEDWRVEVTLDDEQHGYDLGERLRSRDLDDEVRQRLGKRVYVSRNGAQLFLYTATLEQAREAESLLRTILAEEELTARFHPVTRWHPVEQEWKDASIPLPSTDAEVAEELERREEAELSEAAEEGAYDWLVKINLPTAHDAHELADSLEAEGHSVHRVWRWVTVDVLTEEDGNELVETVRARVPDEAQVWLEGNVDDRGLRPAFTFLDPRMW